MSGGERSDAAADAVLARLRPTAPSLSRQRSKRSNVGVTHRPPTTPRPHMIETRSDEQIIGSETSARSEA